MTAKQKACRNCRSIMEEGKTCKKCGSESLTTFWQGFVAIINPEKSQVAQKMRVTEKGKYALRLSR